MFDHSLLEFWKVHSFTTPSAWTLELSAKVQALTSLRLKNEYIQRWQINPAMTVTIFAGHFFLVLPNHVCVGDPSGVSPSDEVGSVPLQNLLIMANATDGNGSVHLPI